MTDISKVVQNGRLTRDSDLQFTNDGKPICKFSIASNAYGDKVGFFDVVLFGKLGESIAKYLTKGKAVTVSGALSQDRWEKEGQKHSKVVIIADNIQMHGGNDNNQSSNNNAPQGQQSSNQGSSFEDDSVPF